MKQFINNFFLLFPFAIAKSQQSQLAFALFEKKNTFFLYFFWVNYNFGNLLATKLLQHQKANKHTFVFWVNVNKSLNLHLGAIRRLHLCMWMSLCFKYVQALIFAIHLNGLQQNERPNYKNTYFDIVIAYCCTQVPNVFCAFKHSLTDTHGLKHAAW